jgi:hypothetical protein
MPLLARCFLDWDHTLYDVDRMFAPIRDDLVRSGSDPGEIDQYRHQLSVEGYSFERHLVLLGYTTEDIVAKAATYRAIMADGDRFLYPGVVEAMRRLATMADRHLLTFGNPIYQAAKVAGVPALHSLLNDRHFVWKGASKGEVVRSYGPHLATWLADDDPSHLIEALDRAPWTRCVRVAWPGTRARPQPGDGTRWPVVTDLHSFVTLVAGSI